MRKALSVRPHGWRSLSSLRLPLRSPERWRWLGPSRTPDMAARHLPQVLRTRPMPMHYWLQNMSRWRTVMGASILADGHGHAPTPGPLGAWTESHVEDPHGRRGGTAARLGEHIGRGSRTYSFRMQHPSSRVKGSTGARFGVSRGSGDEPSRMELKGMAKLPEGHCSCCGSSLAVRSRSPICRDGAPFCCGNGWVVFPIEIGIQPRGAVRASESAGLVQQLSGSGDDTSIGNLLRQPLRYRGVSLRSHNDCRRTEHQPSTLTGGLPGIQMLRWPMHMPRDKLARALLFHYKNPQN